MGNYSPSELIGIIASLKVLWDNNFPPQKKITRRQKNIKKMFSC